MKRNKNALKDFTSRLKVDTRLYLLAFNTGITSEREFYIKAEDDKQSVYTWIDALELEARRRGETHLCRTLRHALMRASAYATEHPGQPVTVWALTDGGDNEPGPGTEPGTPKRLNAVLADFPAIDENSIRANLTILGDLALTITSEKPWFRIRTDADFENIIPPVIEWSPDQPRVGDTVTFFENSPTPYRFYEWRIDGGLSGYTKATKSNRLAEGAHDIQLVVTASNGDKISASRRVVISGRTPPVRLKAEFVLIPGRPQPGQNVQFIGKPRGNPSKFRWLVNGALVAQTEIANYSFSTEGRFEVKFYVEDGAGASDEASQTVLIEEAPLVPRFTADAESQEGQSVRFVNETIGAEGAAFEWDFGDGTRDERKNPSHAFHVNADEPKEFGVILRVESRTGKSYSSDPHRIKVWPKPPKPTALAQASTNFAVVGALIQFVSQSTGLVERVTWRFDGEGISFEPCPAFAFSQPGTNREIILTVEGPGGHDVTKLYVTIAKPEPVATVKWIDRKGQDSRPPSRIEFRNRVPLAHAKSGEYQRPDFDSFDVVLPSGLRDSAGIEVIPTDRLAKGIQLVHHLPNSQQVVPVLGAILESGRYQLRVRPEVAEGDYSGEIRFQPQRPGIKIRIMDVGGAFLTTNVVEIPIALAVGTPGPGALWLYFLVLLLIAAFLLNKLLRIRGRLQPNQDMEVELQEVGSKGDDFGRKNVIQTARFVLPLRFDNRISLGRTESEGDSKHVFDVGAPSAYLLRQEGFLVLKRSPTAKLEPLKNRSFTLLDQNEDQRVVMYQVRALPKRPITVSVR